MICDTSLSYRKKIMNIMGTVTIASTSLCRYSTVAYHKILLKNKSAKKKRKRNVCLHVLFSLAKSRLTSEQGKVRRIVILAIILVCNQHVSTNIHLRVVGSNTTGWTMGWGPTTRRRPWRTSYRWRASPIPCLFVWFSRHGVVFLLPSSPSPSGSKGRIQKIKMEI